MHSNNFLKALAYISGINDSENRKVYVEPACFANSYEAMCLIKSKQDIKSFYEDYIIGCEVVFEMVKT